MAQHLGKILIFDVRLSQSFFRQIEPAHLGILVEIAQNIGHLQRAAKMMRQLASLRVVDAENSRRQSSHRGCDAVAVKIESSQSASGCRVQHPSPCRRSRRENPAFLSPKALTGATRLSSTRSFSPHRALRSPRARLRARRPPRLRAGIVGNIVDGAAERIDLIHGLALLFRQNPHGEIERAPRRGRSRALACQTLSLRPAHGHALFCAHLAVKLRPAPRNPSSSAAPLPRCTVSLNGSRILSMPSSLCASATMAPVSKSQPRILDRERKLGGLRHQRIGLLDK